MALSLSKIVRDWYRLAVLVLTPFEKLMSKDSVLSESESLVVGIDRMT